jgi:uncharacterized membrane-anchored protein
MRVLGMRHDYLRALIVVVFLALAVSTLSMTITKAKVSKPLRDAIAKRSKWFGELFSCPYCMSHWLAFGAVAIYRPAVVDSGVYVVDLFVSSLVIVALASFSAGLIFRAIGAMTP